MAWYRLFGYLTLDLVIAMAAAIALLLVARVCIIKIIGAPQVSTDRLSQVHPQDEREARLLTNEEWSDDDIENMPPINGDE